MIITVGSGQSGGENLVLDIHKTHHWNNRPQEELMRTPSQKTIHFSLYILILVAYLLPAFGHAAEQTGFVKSGEMPIAEAKVTLYRAGTGGSTRSIVLGSTKTDDIGFFNIFFASPSAENAVLYLVAEGPRGKGGKAAISRRSPIRLATVLGTAPYPEVIVINERTTVATAYALAQFLNRGRISGKYPGVQNAALTARNLVNLATGEIGAVLGDRINGESTTTMREFNSLSNLLAACVQNNQDCLPLFRLSRTPSGRAPRNTFQAIENIAHYPWQDVQLLFRLSLTTRVYQPALTPLRPPDAWTLAIRYGIFTDTPIPIPLLDGPGNIAFDSKGNAWVNNNYINAPIPEEVCGDNRVFQFLPNGEPFPGSPFGGPTDNGGLYGAGFGITVDRSENVWVSNFGFQGSECLITDPDVYEGLTSSLSQFDPNGQAVSPSRPDTQFGGWRSETANLLRPQGITSDHDGNIYTVNCANDTITKFPSGQVGLAKNSPVDGLLSNPFAVTTDAGGNVWMTSNKNSTVIQIDQDLNVLQIFDEKPFINLPMGLAVDSLGNVWVSNAGLPSPPCQELSNEEDSRFDIIDSDTPPSGASVSFISGNRRMQSFTGGGLWWPWGIAVDGNDNIWVANFDSRGDANIGIAHFCGARPWNCPPGSTTGTPISPPTGYTSDGLTRVTGVAIDPSGNLWAVNNWILDAPSNQQNPGGHELVVFIGVAAPVKTPLIGPPQQP